MKLAIYGYGNLGKGVECAIQQNKDTQLIGIFTRRVPHTVQSLTGCPVYSAETLLEYKDKIDVLIICGGSATDLPVLTPELSKNFNVVDSFDTHANIPAHYNAVNESALQSNHLALISAGWDPGLFSVNRLYAAAMLPDGTDCTFWGKGVSQGHSDAIRRIKGVSDARQYTVPKEEALKSVRNGDPVTLTARQKHERVCYVVPENNADLAEIERQIVTMPNYFADYDTTVHFITAQELKKEHSGLPHGGFVIRTGKTGINNEHTEVIEYSLKLDSNPEFTGSALVAFARAVYHMSKRGQKGCVTVFDIAPADLSPIPRGELITRLL